jgi:hypothetical protein
LDVGFFGSGIYFTTSAKYSIPYFATKPNPAIIISYLIPGNPYPVVEQPSMSFYFPYDYFKDGLRFVVKMSELTHFMHKFQYKIG